MDDRRTVETRLGPLAVRLLGDGPSAVLWHSLFVDERSWGRVENDLATLVRGRGLTSTEAADVMLAAVRCLDSNRVSASSCGQGSVLR